MQGSSFPYGINEIYKIDYFEAVCFGFISAMQLHGLSRAQAAQEIHKFFSISEDEAPIVAICDRYRKKLHMHKSVMKDFKLGCEADIVDIVEMVVKRMKDEQR